MAEQSKFAGAFKSLRSQPESPGKGVREKQAEKPQPEPITKAGRGGKRSDPDYTPTTFFVRKETKRKAARLLEDTEAGQDLSDLVEQLLSRWISEHSQA
jgi:hypothetical protein